MAASLNLEEDSELWEIVLDRLFVPMCEEKYGEITRLVLEPRYKYDEDDIKKIEKGYKVKKFVCGIGHDEFNRVSICETAKKIWDCLKTSHEGTEQSWESKVDAITEAKDLKVLTMDALIGNFKTHEIN
nr:uncharacterized protein LOC104647704 [Solanum lycopersicum]